MTCPYFDSNEIGPWRKSQRAVVSCALLDHISVGRQISTVLIKQVDVGAVPKTDAHADALGCKSSGLSLAEER
jgi:hypothetical protein